MSEPNDSQPIDCQLVDPNKIEDFVITFKQAIPVDYNDFLAYLFLKSEFSEEDVLKLSQLLTLTVQEFNDTLKNFFNGQNVKVNTPKLKYNQSTKKFSINKGFLAGSSETDKYNDILAYINRLRAFIQLFLKNKDPMVSFLKNTCVDKKIKEDFITFCKGFINERLSSGDYTVSVSGGKKRTTKKYRKKNRKTRSKK